MTGVTILAVVLGAASVATLLGIFALAVIRSGAADSERLRTAALARFAWTAAGWDAFLRGERRKHAESVALFAGLVAVSAILTWGACGGGFHRGGGAVPDPAAVAAVALVLVLGYAVERFASHHYLRWSRRRGDVALFPFGVAIGGVLLDWTRGDLHLRDAGVSAAGDTLELVLSRRSSGDLAESWFRDVLRLPLPTTVDGAALARRLSRTARDDEAP